MSNTPTPHIEARYGDIAETVIMPGDPLRAKFMAERFLEDYKQINGVRGMLGFTGTYKGKRVSIMGHGMGIPSIGIYSYELYNFYGVNTIIRVGSAGAYSNDLNLGDLVLVMGASTDSNYADQYCIPGTFAPIADFDLLRQAADTAERLGYSYKVGNILSSDIFYREFPQIEEWTKMGILAVEMEASGLYMNAARAGKRALTICTISDHVVRGEACSAEERQTTFTKMMDVALACI
ncbi:MAG: purine-nucleoside phosphorylase [Bacteroidaceae bacterium]|nr:purine-nucleoside phosphorylase [Bacteroidaceae bacterium]